MTTPIRKDKNTSYGIIAYKRILGTPHYCMICRKDTYSYVDFIRGKYNPLDITGVRGIVKYFTHSEQERILANLENFQVLWDTLWIVDPERVYSKAFYRDCEISRQKFQTLVEGVVYHGKRITLMDLLHEPPTLFNEPEWGFPKGRRNKGETDMECAVREFEEETGVHRDQIRILPSAPRIEEIYVADNNVEYTHYYFVAECASDLELEFDQTNRNQKCEISSIRWFPLTEALQTIREYNPKKREILLSVHKLLVDA